MKKGECGSSNVELEFTNVPVIFKLIQGKGPIHIHGCHVNVQVYYDEDVDDEIDDDLDDEKI